MFTKNVVLVPGTGSFSGWKSLPKPGCQGNPLSQVMRISHLHLHDSPMYQVEFGREIGKLLVNWVVVVWYVVG